MQASVEQRLLAALDEQAGTTRQLARKASCDTTYAGQVLLGLLHRGQARRWKRPGTRAYVWERA